MALDTETMAAVSEDDDLLLLDIKKTSKYKPALQLEGISDAV